MSADWVCPHDRVRLTARAGEFGCPSCSRVYPTTEGIPRFGEAAAFPALDALWESVTEVGSARALADHAAATGCSRASADWKQFFPVRAGTTVLELGPGAGADTADLAVSGARVLSLSASLAGARIAARTLAEQGAPPCAFAAIDSLERLPLPDDSVDALLLEGAAAASFGLSASAFPRVAAEWARVLRAEGLVLLGLRNRGLPGALALRRALGAPASPESLDRRLRREGGDGLFPLGLGSVVRTMTAAGFAAPLVHAPLPDEQDPRVVLPLGDARAVRYFLRHLIRQNAPLARAAISAAEVLAALDLLRHLVPYHVLLFQAPDRALVDPLGAVDLVAGVS